MKELRDLIQSVAAEANEKANQGWRSISYRDPAVGYFCGIFPFEDRVDLIFEFGVLLPDPDGLLLGEARQVRYLRFYEAAEIEAEQVTGFVQAALDLPPQYAARRALVDSRQTT